MWGWMARRRLGGGRYLRALLHQQARAATAIEEQNRLLGEIILILRRGLLEEAPGTFTTGLPDGKDDAGIYHQDAREMVILLEVEAALARRLGRDPTAEEVVAMAQEEGLLQVLQQARPTRG